MKKVLMMLMALAWSATLMAQEEITNQYLQNADLSTLGEGWNYGDNGYNYTDWNTSADVPVVEFYHTWGAYPGTSIGSTIDFHFTQTITLPAGDYRIAVSAFYREGNGDGTNTKAYIFAGDKQQYVYGLTSGEQLDVNGTTGKYVGSSDLLRAANAFSKGDFSNAFDFSLPTEQEITLGFRGYIDTYCSWCILGPVKLYKYSLEDYLVEYRAKVAEANALSGKMGAAEAQALNDAIVSENSFSLSSEVTAAIVTLTNAINAAKASIANYATLTDVFERASVILQNVAGVVDNDALTAYYNAVSDVQRAYDAGTVTDFAGSVTTVEAALVPLVRYQTADNSDYTLAIVNPHINGSDGWTCERPYGGNGPMLGGNKFEYWAGNAYSRETGSFDYHQEITGLPDGYYKVSASMFNSLNDEGGSYTVFSPTSGLYAVSGDHEVVTLVDIDTWDLAPYTTDEILVTNGTIRIGVKNVVTPMAARWFVADEFHLTLVRTVKEDDAIQFADANVKAICVENWDTNGDGELSYAEAKAVTDLGEAFKENRSITSFNELQYFTGLTEIGEYAFSLCQSLSSVVIPNNVVSIKAYAFERSGLKSITIPKSVTSIEEYAVFAGCSELSSVNVESGNTVYDSRDNCNAIIHSETNKLILGCRNTIIPHSVITIGQLAFHSCKGLKTIFIPNSVTNFEQAAFFGCSGLTTVTIPNTVDFIGVDAFAECSGLSSITIPSSVTTLDVEAFLDCVGLTEVRSEIKEPYAIDGSVFSNRIPGTGGYQFTTATLYVPAGTKALYEATDGWNLFQNIVEMEGGTSSIPTDGLVAYYPFNGNANDESGHGNNGTVIGHVELTTDRFGNANSAYRFFGEPLNYISVPDDESLHLSTFTLNAWVYTDAEDYSNGVLINKGRDIENGSYRLWANGVEATNEYGGNNNAHIEEMPQTNIWHMISGTVEGDQAKFYIDGVLMLEATLTHPFVYNNNEPLTLGMHYYEGVPDYWAYPLLGILDDVRIYNRALSVSEIQALYAENDYSGQSPIPTEAIDLGLPSGTKWAPWNVGASKPEDYGGYYAWGETEEKDVYDWSTSMYYDMSSYSYIDIGSNIAGTQYDVAHVKWGGSWTMPTLDQVKELLDYCTSEWTTVNGIYGHKFTGPNGSTIFLPAAGFRWDGEFHNVGSWGEYWSSTLCEGYLGNAYGSDFDSSSVNWSYSSRDIGYSVRPVNASSGDANAEPYAVLSEDNTVLTFYYDGNKAERNGMDVGPFEYNFSTDAPNTSWYDQHESIITVVFDDSFANFTSLTSTKYWFHACNNLTTIIGIENLKTDNVTDMGAMFYICSSLTSLDVSGFNTYNVTAMSSMFAGCSSLTSLDLSSFKTDNVTNMSGMFDCCSSLTSLDVSGFKTDNVTDMSYMFYSCSSLTSLDVSGFKTDNVTSMSCMFYNCSNLTTIYAGDGWSTASVTDSDEMFTDCTNLVGGQGTVYDENHTDHTYARIDGGVAAPGYFTAKNADTDISQLDNVIYIEQTKALVGSETTLSIKMKNTAQIRGFQFDMYLPEGVTVAQDNKGRLAASLNTSRLEDGDDHTLTVGRQADGSYRFLCGSIYEETFTGNDGEVATVKLNIAADMEVGSYPLVLRNIKMTENDITNTYMTDEVRSILTLIDYVTGDINGDGAVDVSDYIGIANHILGQTPQGFNAKAADVDENGVIDVSDYIGVANIILTGSIYGSQQQSRISRHGYIE